MNWGGEGGTKLTHLSHEKFVDKATREKEINEEQMSARTTGYNSLLAVHYKQHTPEHVLSHGEQGTESTPSRFRKQTTAIPEARQTIPAALWNIRSKLNSTLPHTRRAYVFR